MMTKRLASHKSGHNQKYQINHRKIQIAFISFNQAHRWHITLSQILKRTKLTKRTLYAHYPDPDKALTIIEQELLKDYELELQKQLSQKRRMPVTNRHLFFAIMLYMAKNKDIFIRVCSDIANYTLLYRFVERIYPLLDIIWYPTHLPKPMVGDERVNMYVTMCVEIIGRWGIKTGCDIAECEYYLSRLLRLTQEASGRCR